MLKAGKSDRSSVGVVILASGIFVVVNIVCQLLPLRQLIVRAENVNEQTLFRHSDIFGSKASLQDFEDYGVTFVSWGGAPKPNAKWFARLVNNAKENGTLYGAKIGTVTNWQGFINFAPDELMDSVCRRVDGEPIIISRLKNITYQGYPAYYFCTNSPKFREYLKRNVKVAMESGAEGIMMDDPLGTAFVALWAAGCYCSHCMTKFQKYLKENYTQSELMKKGIVDVELFDLRKYHLEFANLPAKKRLLYKEFLDFQFVSSAEMFREVMNYALKIRRKPVPVSGNINPANRFFGHLLTDVDYYACECRMSATSGFINEATSLLTFKIADALNRPASIMGYGTDHAFIAEKNLPGMIRCWVAEAYAFGNYFKAPYTLWAYSKDKGAHYYQPRHKSEVAPMYQFIKYHADFFDDYEVVTKVALVLSYKAYRKGSKSVETLINQLADLNMPFEIIIAGDKALKVHFVADELAKYDTVIVPSDAILAPVDGEVLRRFKANGGMLIDNIEELDLSTQIKIVGAEKIRATLRSASDDLNRPIVVHLLNRDYDVSFDSCRPKTNFLVRIPKALCQASQILGVRYVRPNSWEPQKAGYFLRPQRKLPDLDLKFRMTQDNIEVTVPSLDTCGIIVLFPQ